MRGSRNSRSKMHAALALTLTLLLLAAVFPAACFAAPIEGLRDDHVASKMPSPAPEPHHAGAELCEHTPLAVPAAGVEGQGNSIPAAGDVAAPVAVRLPLEPAVAVEIYTLPPPPSVVLGTSNLRI